MDIERLETKITRKADNEVEYAVREFRRDVRAALRKLFCIPPHATAIPECFGDEPYASVLRNISESRKKWPKELWTKRENVLRDEIMCTMDTGQKVLLVKDSDTPSEDSAGPAD